MNLPPKATLLFSVLLLLALAWLDIFSSDELRITSLYLIPILLVTWNNGRKWGYVFSAFSFVILVAIDSMAESSPHKHLYFYIDTFGRFFSYLIVIVLASNLRAAYDRERRLARTDALTHLMNRHAFYASLEVEIARSVRHAQPFSLLYLDCDNFKQVNDTMGHGEGDRLLRLIGETMRKNVRKGDFVARLGGDEFAIFFSDVNVKGIGTIASDLTQKLQRAVAARYPQVSFSTGIAVFLNAPPSLDDAIMRADELMYRVKAAGKNGLLQQVF
ncbi:MAG TPA: GGDEF domain-containing protein [Burkholderiaceae bacterium]|jgi:diguanylate cyclase (GGDEF)-like protein